MFSNATSKIIVNSQKHHQRSYPALNSIPLRKKLPNRPCSSNFQSKKMRLIHKNNYSVQKSLIEESAQTKPQDKIKQTIIPKEILDRVVQDNFLYFREKLQSENKSIPAKHKLKYLSKTNNTIYAKDYSEIQAQKQVRTERVTCQKNTSKFDGMIKPQIDIQTIYNQQFIYKNSEKYQKQAQKLTIDKDAPFSNISLYASDYIKWGAKANKVTLQTKPYEMVSNLPFSKDQTTYKTNFKQKKDKNRIDNSNSLANRATLGPKISNKLKLEHKTIKQTDHNQKKNLYKKQLSQKTCIRSKMQTLGGSKVSQTNYSRIKKKSQYSKQYQKKPSNKGNKENIRPQLSVQDLKILISQL